MRFELFWLPIFLSVSSPEILVDEVGSWRISREKSALTDFESVYAEVESEKGGKNLLGQIVKPQFGIVCHQKTTAVLFDIQEYMGKERLLFKYRIDGGPVRTQFGDVSSNGRVFGFWGLDGLPFLRELEGKSELVVAAEPYNEASREAVFSIDGIDRVVSEVRKACGW